MGRIAELVVLGDRLFDRLRDRFRRCGLKGDRAAAMLVEKCGKRCLCGHHDRQTVGNRVGDDPRAVDEEKLLIIGGDEEVAAVENRLPARLIDWPDFNGKPGIGRGQGLQRSQRLLHCGKTVLDHDLNRQGLLQESARDLWHQPEALAGLLGSDKSDDDWRSARSPDRRRDPR